MNPAPTPGDFTGQEAVAQLPHLGDSVQVLSSDPATETMLVSFGGRPPIHATFCFVAHFLRSSPVVQKYP